MSTPVLDHYSTPVTDASSTPQYASEPAELPKVRQRLLNILLEHAEEPEDIKDGTGTFTTFRTEYLLNDLAQELERVREEERSKALKAITEAFWDGVDQGKYDAGEAFSAEDYLISHKGLKPHE